MTHNNIQWSTLWTEKNNIYLHFPYRECVVLSHLLVQFVSSTCVTSTNSPERDMPWPIVQQYTSSNIVFYYYLPFSRTIRTQPTLRSCTFVLEKKCAEHVFPICWVVHSSVALFSWRKKIWLWHHWDSFLRALHNFIVFQNFETTIFDRSVPRCSLSVREFSVPLKNMHKNGYYDSSHGEISWWKMRKTFYMTFFLET